MFGVGDDHQASAAPPGQIGVLAARLGQQPLGVLEKVPFPAAGLEQQVARRARANLGGCRGNRDRGSIAVGLAHARRHHRAAAHRVAEQGDALGIDFRLLQ